MFLQRDLFQLVFDASSLINIERARKMAYLRRLREIVLIPEKVAQEINLPNSPLHRFVSKYPSVITYFQNNEEEEYLRIRSQIGIDDGEAAAIAMAIRRSLPLVIDDIKGKLKADTHGVKTHSWQDFLSGHVFLT